MAEPPFEIGLVVVLRVHDQLPSVEVTVVAVPEEGQLVRVPRVSVPVKPEFEERPVTVIELGVTATAPTFLIISAI